MLLANLAKAPSIERLVEAHRTPPSGLPKSDLTLNQLLDVFVRGADGGYNRAATYDYLAYLFGDLAKVREKLQPRGFEGPASKRSRAAVRSSGEADVGVAVSQRRAALRFGARLR